MIPLFVKNILLDDSRKYKLAFISSFSIGALIATIPHTYKFIENYKMEILSKKERKLQLKEKRKNVKTKIVLMQSLWILDFLKQQFQNSISVCKKNEKTKPISLFFD